MPCCVAPMTLPHRLGEGGCMVYGRHLWKTHITRTPNGKLELKTKQYWTLMQINGIGLQHLKNCFVLLLTNICSVDVFGVPTSASYGMTVTRYCNNNDQSMQAIHTDRISILQAQHAPCSTRMRHSNKKPTSWWWRAKRRAIQLENLCRYYVCH